MNMYDACGQSAPCCCSVSTILHHRHELSVPHILNGTRWCTLCARPLEVKELPIGSQWDTQDELNKEAEFEVKAVEQLVQKYIDNNSPNGKARHLSVRHVSYQTDSKC